MKKVLLLLIVMSCVLAFASTGHAWVYSAYPLNGDEFYAYDRYSWDGYNHTFVYLKTCDWTAIQVLMDPDGRPWLYYYGVFNWWNYTLDLYYSWDGWNWYYDGWVYF